MTHEHPRSLPSAGESLLRQANEHAAYFYCAIGMILGLWLIAATSWIMHFLGRAYEPWMIAATALGVTVIMGVRFRRRLPELRNGLKGAQGERAVADVLHELGKDGYVAMHDIEFKRGNTAWNVDHVLIGPAGVFVIETKWRVKGTKISFDGNQIYDNGTPTTIICQVIRNADDVRKIVEPSLGNIPVRPVVLYPNASVDDLMPKSGATAWVLRPRQLFSWLPKEQQSLDRKQVRAVYELLANHAKRPVTL